MSASPAAASEARENAFDDAEHNPDCIRFLVATDNHIGFMEKDPIRGQDAINTFKEILQIAVDQRVDFILLGGDLFHDNKPSRSTLHQVIALLREFTFGDAPIALELQSDPGRGYKEGYSFPSVNYADENLNVGIPVFSIHGNHDDPQGSGPAGSLSALDILSVAGLITYFGRTDLPSDDSAASAPANGVATAPNEADPGIRIKPILLRKGSTKLALYGLGHVRDERLHFELRANRVRLQRPAQDTDEWFNVLILHQNRARHNLMAAIPEGLFDDSTHLVIWGHEHDCRINPEEVTGKKYAICQPGSSVATSLMPGETEDKHVAVVSVIGQDYKVDPIKLRTVRPFVMDEIDLEAELAELRIKADDKDRITKVLRDRVTMLIKKAAQQWEAEHGSAQPRPERMLPLVRLRVIYTNQIIGNPVRFGQEFAGKVSNPKDVLQFSKRKEASTKRSRADRGLDGDLDDVLGLDEAGIVPAERLERVQIGALMKQILYQQNMQVLNPKELQDALTKYAEKDNKDALTDSLHSFLSHMQTSLAVVANEEELDRKLDSIRAQQEEDEGDDGDLDDLFGERGRSNAAPQSSRKGKMSRARPQREPSEDSMREMDVDEDEEEAEDAPGPSSGKGKGRSNASAPPKSTAKAVRSTSSRQQATHAPVEEEADDDQYDEHVEEISPPPKKARSSALSQLGGKKTPSSRARAGSTSTTMPAPRSRPSASKSTSGAKSGPALRQSQLDFGTGSTRQAAKRAQAKISHAAEDDDDEDEIIDDDEDEDHDGRGDGAAYRPRGGTGKHTVIEIGDSEDDDDDLDRTASTRRTAAGKQRATGGRTR